MLPSLLKMPLGSFLPNRSVSFGTNFIKDIHSTTEPRILIITGHLYLDYLISRMANKEIAARAMHSRSSFRDKLDALNVAGKLDITSFQALSAVNTLRNRFAHDLFYDLADWNPTALPYIAEFGLRIPKRRHLRIAFSVIVIRLTLFVLLIELSKKYRWLHLEDVPRWFTRRPITGESAH